MVISLPMKLISSKSAPWDLIKKSCSCSLTTCAIGLLTTEEYIIMISVMKTYCTFSDRPIEVLIRKITDLTTANDLPLALFDSFYGVGDKVTHEKVKAAMK